MTIKCILLLVLLVQLSKQLHFQKMQLSKHFQKKNLTNEITNAAGLYRKDWQIQKQIDSVVKNNPSIFKKFTCQNTDKYKYLIADKQNTDKYKYLIANKQNNRAQKYSKNQVVVLCNVHARQLLVSQVCLDFLSMFAQNIEKRNNQNKNQSTTKDNQFNSDSVNTFLDSNRLTMFYRGNSERDKVIAGQDYCIRKDQNNIDLNRNFPTNFNLYNTKKNSQQYPGDYPLSEPLSQCLNTYLTETNKTHKINIFIDIHTGQFTLFDSFGSQSIPGFETRPILQKLKLKYCPQCRITTVGTKQDDQQTDGQIFADIKKRFNADHSVLLQIYGGFNQNLNSQQNCMAIFNPLTQKSLQFYKNIWKNGLFYFIKQSVKKIKQQ